MGNLYTQPAISGFNSSPPTDDGSKTTANRLTWQYHVDKIGTPLKNYVDSINSAIETSFSKIFLNGVVEYTSNHTVQVSERGQVLSCSNTITISMLGSASAGEGFVVSIINNGSGTVTVDPDASETVNGSSTLALYPGESCILTTDGSNWFGPELKEQTPAGVVKFHAGDTVPNGYLEMDGSAVSRVTYARLYSAIGENYGAGDGSTTFNLPDARGYFPRFFDNTAGNDPDSASRTDRGDGTDGDNVGTKQADEFKSHTHNITQPDNVGAGSGNPTFGTTGTPSGATGGNETRPLNIYFMGIIKY